MAAKKQVRIIKKVRDTDGVWRFVSLDRAGKKYVWDNRPGTYVLEWWEGRKRKCEVAGQTPSRALEAQFSKGNELIGEMLKNVNCNRTNNLIREQTPNRKIAGDFSLVRGAGSNDSPTNFMKIIIVQPFKFHRSRFT